VTLIKTGVSAVRTFGPLGSKLNEKDTTQLYKDTIFEWEITLNCNKE
jgi:hypothetical protein